MTKDDHHLYQPSALLKEMNLLSVLRQDPFASQKTIASKVGCSVSSIHGYLHDLEQRGLVRFNRHSSHKVEYFLTPQGLEHLNELQGLLLEEGARLHKQMLEHVAEVIHRVALEGFSDLMVIADPDVRDFVHRAAKGTGVEIHVIESGFDSEATDAPGSNNGSRAVVVLGAQTDGGSERLISRYEEQGVPVYRIPPATP
jgi:DNA-binding MarR family transcriptional regulator